MDIDSLVREGRYQEAALAARAAGDFARARELFEKIWEFRDAAECAQAAGDRRGALRNLIEARELDRAAELAREMTALGPDDARAAAEIYEQRRLYGDAAAILEALGDVERAALLYQKGAQFLDAGRLYEQLGRLRDAGRLYEKFLAGEPDGAQSARARLALGRLLARLRQHEAAARALQEAVRGAGDDDEVRREAQRLLVVELAALGLRDAARDALATARRADPTLPNDLDELLGRTALPRATADADAESVVGGRYRLSKLLGAGGSGRVYRARDDVSGRDVAVKLFYAAQARGRDAYERFLREARICGAVKHPNLVEVLDVREDLGFLVLELMVGTLADRLREREPPRLPPPLARRFALDVCAGLEFAHSRGIVHRDIKPANVFFDARGTAKLGDFGVAHLLDLGQTQTGGLIGTLAYMSPEQITGAPLTFAADLYALGVTLYQALTGRLPFLGPDFVAQHLGENPPLASEAHPELGTAWDEVLERLLAKDPTARFVATDELRAAIGTVEVGERRTVLVLPRAGADAPAARSEPAPVAEGGRTLDGERYQAEVPLGQTTISQLFRAVDRALDRSVVIERFVEGQPDAPMEARLHRLAAASGPHLQRVLSYDRASRSVVFEAPVGEALSARLAAAPLEAREIAAMLACVARTLEPLHGRGGVHGAIDASRVVIDDAGLPTLVVAGMGPRPPDASAERDIADCMALAARARHVEPGSDATAALVAALADDLLADAALAPPPRDSATLLAFAECLARELARAARTARHVGEMIALARKRGEPRLLDEIRARALRHGLPGSRVDALLT
jgi:eukaryotic-like serine/threonine-protein kinase